MAKSIVFTRDTCGGAPRIQGTRLTCANVVLFLNQQQSLPGDFFEHYPYLDLDDLLTCLSYCARRQCIEDKVINYCTGCSLDMREDDDTPSRTKEMADLIDLASKSGLSKINPSTELSREDSQDVWRISTILLERLRNLS